MKFKPNPQRVCRAFLLVAYASIIHPGLRVFAADSTWTGTTNGNFTTNTNWSTGANPGISGSTASAGANPDVATFISNTNSPLIYTSTSPADVNLGGILFSGTAGAITFQSGSTGSGTRRIYLTAGGSGVVMDTTVTSTMTFARTGISSGASGDVYFTNNASTSSAILNMASTFNSLAPAASTLVLGGTNTGLNAMGNIISNTGGATLSLTKSGSGTWILNAANTHTGTTTLNDGILGLGSSSALSSGTLQINGGTLASAGAAARTITNNITAGGNFALGGLTANAITLNGTLDLGSAVRTISLGNSATIGGVVSNGGLTIASGLPSRSLTLDGTNTYSGATLVSSGTLLVNGALSNSSTVTVSPGATIGGDGSIANSLAVDFGGFLQPGLTPGAVGSLDSGALTLTGTYLATITGNGANDFLNITGAANFGGTIVPFLASYSPLLNDAFNLADWTGTFSGTPVFDYSNAVLDPGLGWDESTFAADGTLRIVAIPEPAAAMLGALGLLAILRRRKV